MLGASLERVRTIRRPSCRTPSGKPAASIALETAVGDAVVVPVYTREVTRDVLPALLTAVRRCGVEAHHADHLEPWVFVKI